MKKPVAFNLAKLRSFNPCYDPGRHLPEDWQGTVVDILEHKDIPPQDKLRIVCREEFLSARLLRRFAIAQARTCRKNVTDKKEFDRILQVCRRFTEGKATNDELVEAESAALRAAHWAACVMDYPTALMAAEWAAFPTARSAAFRAAETAALLAVRFATASDSAAYSRACRMLLRMIRADLRRGK